MIQRSERLGRRNGRSRSITSSGPEPRWSSRHPFAVTTFELGLQRPQGLGRPNRPLPTGLVYMMVKQGNGIRHGYVARGGVVEVVQKMGDLGLFEVCQQIDDPVDG